MQIRSKMPSPWMPGPKGAKKPPAMPPAPPPAPDPNAGAKKDLQDQTQSDKEQEALTKASNMQKKIHDTCMAIIANIK